MIPKHLLMIAFVPARVGGAGNRAGQSCSRACCYWDDTMREKDLPVSVWRREKSVSDF